MDSAAESNSQKLLEDFRLFSGSMIRISYALCSGRMSSLALSDSTLYPQR